MTFSSQPSNLLGGYTKIRAVRCVIEDDIGAAFGEFDHVFHVLLDDFNSLA